MTTTHGTSKASQVSSLHRLEGGIVLEDDSGLLVPNCRGAENDPKFLVHGYCNVSFHPNLITSRTTRELKSLALLLPKYRAFPWPFTLSCLWHGVEFDTKTNWNMYCFRGVPLLCLYELE